MLSVAVNKLRRGCLLGGRRGNPIKPTTSLAFTVFTDKYGTLSFSLAAPQPSLAGRSPSTAAAKGARLCGVKAENLESFRNGVKVIFKSIFLLEGALAAGLHQRCCCFSSFGV